MRKGFILSVFIICTLYIGCSKSPVNKAPTTVTLKITLVSGGGQTDTIGNTLANPITVEVTVNGVPLAGYPVQFRGSGCNQDNITAIVTQPGGTASYNWTLAGDVGQQTLTAYVLNSDNQKVDSVKTNATGIAPGPGWHNGACSLQGSLLPSNFCKLSTGRLFTCYAGGQTSLRYSDDNGASWNAVTSLGNSHRIDYVISSPSDELYVFALDGAYYSKDAGQTWTNVDQPVDPSTITAAAVTPSGKIMITSNMDPPVSISTNKAQSWTTIRNTVFSATQTVFPFFNCPAEDKNGNLYVTDSYNGQLFKSADGGTTWTLTPQISVVSYIDNNNQFYIDLNNQPHVGIFVSDDEGVGYSGYMVLNQKFSNMSVQSDGNFYYEDQAGLYVFDSYNVGTLLFPFNGTGFQSYIVAKNNNLVVGNWGKPYIRYYSK